MWSGASQARFADIDQAREPLDIATTSARKPSCFLYSSVPARSLMKFSSSSALESRSSSASGLPDLLRARHVPSLASKSLVRSARWLAAAISRTPPARLRARHLSLCFARDRRNFELGVWSRARRRRSMFFLASSARPCCAVSSAYSFASNCLRRPSNTRTRTRCPNPPGRRWPGRPRRPLRAPVGRKHQRAP